MAINLSKTQEELTEQIMGKVSLSKDKVTLTKHAVNLSKTVINISEKTGIDLSSVKAQVILVMDYSGSMKENYGFKNSGKKAVETKEKVCSSAVQNAINIILPVGMLVDNNGEIESFIFDDHFKQLKSITINNYETYVWDHMTLGNMNGTQYAPVLKEIKKLYIDKTENNKNGLLNKLFGKKTEEKIDPLKQTTDDPILVLYMTDGDAFDKSETKKVVMELSETKTFIQFFGIGNKEFQFLKELDNLPNRKCDNTGFERISDLQDISDEELYNKIFKQFAQWLKTKNQ